MFIYLERDDPKSTRAPPPDVLSGVVGESNNADEVEPYRGACEAIGWR